jgi:hypothetical protein
MNQETANSNPVNELPRCQKHTRNGRYRMLVADSSSTLCAEHSRTPSKNRNSADLSAILTAGLTEFKSALPINDFLSRLLLNQAEGRIPPRRAAVMAYTCNLLLRTLPAIEHEVEVIEGPAHLDFTDWPRRDRDQHVEPIRVIPGDIPRPDRSQPYTGVVHPTPNPIVK